jgi:hypothetical protein
VLTDDEGTRDIVERKLIKYKLYCEGFVKVGGGKTG